MNSTDTVHRFFEDQVRQNPEHIAIQCEEQHITYADLNHKANQLAYFLRQHGVMTESPVALCMHRSIDLFIAILAVLKAGGAYVPLDPTHHEDRLLYILNDNGNPCVIIQADLKEKFSFYMGHKVVLTDFNDEKKDNLPAFSTTDNLAYIIYTSGTTGRPKGVLIEHKSMVNYSLCFQEYCQFKLQQRIDFSQNYIFDMAMTTSLMPLMLGLTIVICQDDVKKCMRSYLEYLNAQKIQIIKLTPSFFKVLLQELEYHFIPLPYLEMIIFGGENLSSADCATWMSLYPDCILYNEYGPTETTVAMTLYTIRKEDIPKMEPTVPIGRPLSNVECYIFDAQNNELPDNKVGELCIGGICLARGYLNQPEMTTQKFIPHPLRPQERLYKTGDLCRKRSDGILEIIGRIDSQIKIRGFRIELSEIEKYFLRHSSIKSVIVIPQEASMGEKRLIAYYILKEDLKHKPPSPNELREYLKEGLPDYMIPSALVRVETFSLTPNGKLDMSALPVPQWVSNQDFVAPKTDMEKKLAHIWSEALGIPTIGLSDNFFELGGNSLTAALIISKINYNFAKDIRLYEFYAHPTIQQLSNIISKAPEFLELNFSNEERAKFPLSDFQFLLWLSNLFNYKAKKLNIVARKRIKGRLNKVSLIKAFDLLIKNHPILSYQVSIIRPFQYIHQRLPFTLLEENIQHIPEREREKKLNKAMQQLIFQQEWNKNKPNMIAKLFYIDEHLSELQVALPHMFADEISLNIIFKELSEYYLLFEKKDFHEADAHIFVKPEEHYKHYTLKELNKSSSDFTQDVQFWAKYFKDAYLLTLPSPWIISSKSKKNYSTYVAISEQSIAQLKQFCAQNKVSILDGLTAAFLLAIFNTCPHSDVSRHALMINIVKSTRESQSLHEALGCFLRIEPIKLQINRKDTFSSLSKRVHQAILETSPHQHCSNLIKLASIRTIQQKKSIFRGWVGFLTRLYGKVFGIGNYYQKILTLCAKLITFKTENGFMINVNISNRLVSNALNEDMTSFGFKTQPSSQYQYDVLTIDSILEMFISRDDNHHPFLVISANLKPIIRKKIGEEVSRILLTLNESNLLKLNE